MIIPELARFFTPWHDRFGGSTIYPIVTEATHLLAMFVGGGLAVAADRTTLRLQREKRELRRAVLNELCYLHRPVLIALSISLLSGLAFATADIDVFLLSPAFYIKMGFVGLLLANGALLQRTEVSLRKALKDDPVRADAFATRQWDRLRFRSICSIALWSATLVAGVILFKVA